MYTRKAKETHLDTVRYEIDMLDFCLRRLIEEPQPRDDGDRNVYLEGFLVHYRNLIRFFSSQHPHGNDLRMNDPFPWAVSKLTDTEIERVKKPAETLDKKYFNEISAYVQHCTKERHDLDKSWDVLEMYRELDALVSDFETIIPRTPPESPRSALYGLKVSTVQTVRTQALG
jgi:hypothetical protein